MKSSWPIRILALLGFVLGFAALAQSTCNARDIAKLRQRFILHEAKQTLKDANELIYGKDRP